MNETVVNMSQETLQDAETLVEASNGIAVGGIRIPDLFRDLPEAVIVAGADHRITWVNPAFETLFGYSREEITGEITKDLYADPENYKEQGQSRFTPTSTLSDHNYEMRYRRKSGKVILTQTTGGPIRDTSGEVLGYFAIIKDISKTRAIEELLHKLFHITTDQDMDPAAKVQSILKLGCEHFQTDSALVSWVRDDSYTILYSHSDLVDIPRGTSFPFGDTYCSEMLNGDGPLACHNAKQSQFATHPCYDLFLLETYIGVPLIVNGVLFGTLNFTSPEARHPFETGDLEMIKLFAAWVGQQLNFEKETNQLPAKTTTQD
ncbi:PAS domain S-box protein [Pseudophaeobacter sp.]|uniref:PAS domain S-box protein n=1 Tax=Pseudophaeobacter sp. TaxID=1971739 RepID=UPI0032980401